MWLISLSQHMSNYPKIFKVYFAVRNLNRGTYISTEFNQARNLTEFLYDFNCKYFSFLCGGKKLQLNGHVTDKLLRHFGNKEGTGAKMRPAVLSGIVPGDVPLSDWPFFSSPRSPCKSWHDHVSYLKWRKKREKTSCLGLLFCIPESFYGEIPLDKILIQRPDWNQGDCESDS